MLINMTGRPVDTHFSYQPTDARERCNRMGNSPKASDVWLSASTTSFTCSSVRSDGYRDKIAFASLLRCFCGRQGGIVYIQVCISFEMYNAAVPGLTTTLE